MSILEARHVHSSNGHPEPVEGWMLHMQIRAEEISDILKKHIQNYDAVVDRAEVGTVISVGDGIARVHGLEKVMAGELLEFPGGIKAIALNLDEDDVGCAIMGSDVSIKEGDL